MIGLDTNVVLRYFVADDPEQSERVRKLLDSRCTAEDPGFISHVVLCELVWVLGAAYQLGRDQIVRIIEELLDCTDIQLQEPDIVRSALAIYREGRASFADLIICGTNLSHGCEATATFDRKAAQLEGFVSVP